MIKKKKNMISITKFIVYTITITIESKQLKQVLKKYDKYYSVILNFVHSNSIL